MISNTSFWFWYIYLIQIKYNRFDSILLGKYNKIPNNLLIMSRVA